MARKPAERQPCAVCGGPIPLTLRANARVCSEACATERARLRELKRSSSPDRVAYVADYEQRRKEVRHAAFVPVRCEVCGKEIMDIRPGMRAKTCSPACAQERARRKESARYHKEHKDDPAFWEKVQDYRTSLRQRLDSDPKFAAEWQAKARVRLARWSQRRALAGLLETGRALQERREKDEGDIDAD